MTAAGFQILGVGRCMLGTAPLGGLFEPVSDREATATLSSAWEHGVRGFDTAPLYGLGVAERRLGRFLSTCDRSEAVVSTKVGRLLRDGTGVFDFSAAGIRQSLEESLERLGLDRVDVVLLHDPDDHLDQAIDEAYPVLDELRARGVVSAVGAGMNQSAGLTRLVRETDLDVVLLAGRYTLLEQSALEDLLPTCVELDTPVLAAGVFNSGVLAAPTASAHFDYAPVTGAVLTRVRALAAVCAEHSVPLSAAALQFPFGHPAVASVVIGARSPDEVEQNLRQIAEPVPPELWTDLYERGLVEAAPQARVVRKADL